MKCSSGNQTAELGRLDNLLAPRGAGLLSIGPDASEPIAKRRRDRYQAASQARRKSLFVSALGLGPKSAGGYSPPSGPPLEICYKLSAEARTRRAGGEILICLI